MPELRRFKKNSIIYFDGDRKGNAAYLLKEGLCVRQKVSAETGEVEASRLAVGEFFGTKSALGNFMRDETIEVKEDSIVYAFKPAELEVILKKNPTIIFKVLRVYSNELRLIHKAIESLLGGAVEGTSNNERIRDMGDYYFGKKAYKQGVYVYRKYLQLVPDSPFKAELEEKIVDAQEDMVAQGQGS